MRAVAGLAPFAFASLLACASFSAADESPVAGADAAGASDAATDGGCGDLQSDRDNCGACGRRCTSGEACDRGACFGTGCAGAAAVLRPVGDYDVPSEWKRVPAGGSLASSTAEGDPSDGDGTYAAFDATANGGRLILSKAPLAIPTTAVIERVAVIARMKKRSGAMEVHLGFQSDEWKAKYNDAFLNSGAKSLTEQYQRVEYERSDQAFGGMAPWTFEALGATRFSIQVVSTGFPAALSMTQLWMEICYR